MSTVGSNVTNENLNIPTLDILLDWARQDFYRVIVAKRHDARFMELASSRLAQREERTACSGALAARRWASPARPTQLYIYIKQSRPHPGTLQGPAKSLAVMETIAVLRGSDTQTAAGLLAARGL